MTGIWAIVLAAGESRRMGSPKMLLSYNDVTIIEQVIRNLLDSSVDRVPSVPSTRTFSSCRVARVMASNV